MTRRIDLECKSKRSARHPRRTVDIQGWMKKNKNDSILWLLKKLKS
jgi:signal recognition particle subunit SEC65